NQTLESIDSIKFSMFFAGAVANHQPTFKYVEKDSVYGFRNYKTLTKYGQYFAKLIAQNQQKFNMKENVELDYIKVEFPLPSPQVKLSDKLGFRPWVFYTLMGKHRASLDCFRLGNLVFIGTPCDASGEFYRELEPIARKDGLELILTSFNGEYIGYIIPDNHYLIAKSEAREMNWYGPVMGSHLVHFIKNILHEVPR
ncbi:MAG: hypothetical protein ACOCUL_02705, partial [Bacteroidota bacterium]